MPPFTPPQGVQDEAARAVQWISDGLAGDGFTAVGRRRAQQLADGEPVSVDTLERMRSYFARHEADTEVEGFNSGEEGFPTPGRVAWSAWGGDAGRTWSVSTLDELEDELEEPTRSDMTVNDEYRRTDDGVEVPELEHRRLADVELRMDGDTPVLDGYALVYEYRYDVAGGPEAGGFTEVIARGAAAKSAGEADVRLLVNHDGVPLARSRGGEGTLTLSSDDVGLKVRAELDPANPKVQELRSAMNRGDLDQMSFAFRIPKGEGRQEWSKDYTVRTIREVQLFDVSVVTYPANPATVAKLRNDEAPAEEATEEVVTGRSLDVARAQFDRLRRS
jgi:HK97 family phage prohead protease